MVRTRPVFAQTVTYIVNVSTIDIFNNLYYVLTFRKAPIHINMYLAQIQGYDSHLK